MPAETNDKVRDEGSASSEEYEAEDSDFDDSLLREVARMPPPFRKPAVGERLGGPDGLRFIIMEELGGGSMGQVFSAWDEELQREVALKFLLPEGLGGTPPVSLLRREARAIAHLNHENIVRIFDVSEMAGASGEPGVPCLVMERLEGESLEALLRREKPLGLRRSLEIMTAVAAGLAHAHERGLVHRDLKPSNVFITRQGTVKLLDFGLAHLLAAGSSLLPHLPTAGTPSYMAPEQWRGEKQDARTDVWAAGVMLFEMLTGRPPYTRGPLAALRQRALSSEPVPLVRTRMPELPEEVETLVATALAKESQRRFPSAQELRDQLRLLEERLGPWREEPRALAPERRQVTLVSCKLAGLGSMAAALDSEDLNEVEAAFHQSCSEIIQQHGGSITTCVGEAVLACFGYPVAQEEDSEHAVRAGMALSRSLPEVLRKQLSHLSLGRLGVCVGLHTEMVVFDDILPELRGRTPTIQGEAPRIAVWLAEQSSGHNAVILSHTTHTLVQRSFDAERLGTHTFKGLAGKREMECWRVVRARKAVFRFDRALAVGKLSPLVDRKQEMQQLLDWWARAEQGQGGLVLITGEAGIGKSRLIQELRERVSPETSVRIRCQCWSQFNNSAFYPIVEMLQHLLHLDPEGLPPQNLRALEAQLGKFGVAPERMALIAAFLSLPIKENLPVLQRSPERQKERTFEALADLLLRIAREQPVLGIVEDLHWADPSTLTLLGYLLEKLEHSRVLLVLSARTSFQLPWKEQSRLRRLVLERLSAELTGTLVKEAAGDHALSEEMVRQLVAKTDGIPLFAEEMTYMMLERATAGGPPSFGTLQSIPVTLHELLLARLDMLPARQKALAQLCAVVGRGFSLVLLATLTRRSPNGLRRDVESLVASGLLQPVDDAEPSYQFRHALLQEAAYQSLLRGTRRQHHRRIAQALVEQFPDWVEAQPELLAHHYTEAGEFQPAVQYWAQAGIRASLRSANREAVNHLQKALKLLRTLPDRDQRIREELQLLIALGIPLSQEQGYRSPEVKQTYSRARELFLQVGESLPQLELSYWGPFAYYFARAEYTLGHELAEQLVGLGQRHHNPELLSLGYRMMGADFFTWGRMKQGLEYVERALACSDFTLEEHRALAVRHWTNPQAMALVYACVIHSATGQEERARYFEREALELSRRLSHPHTLAFVLTYAGVARMMRRDVPGTLQLAEECHALAREHWFRLWLVWSGLLVAWARSELGHPEEGLVQMRSWLGAWRMAGIRAGMPLNIGLLAEVHLRLRQPGEALAVVREGLKWVAAFREAYFESELYRIEGEALRALGRTDEARDSFLQAVRVAYAQGAHGFEQHALGALGLSRPGMGMQAQEPQHP